VHRPALVLAVVLVACVLGVAATAARTSADPRRDTKGSYWPGPGFVWGTSGPCAGIWIDTRTGSCGEGGYVEDEGPLLDLVKIAQSRSGATLTHALTMRKNWVTTLLSTARQGQISLYFSTDKDKAFERRLDLYLRRGKLAAIMRNAKGRSVGTPSAKRVGRNGVSVSFNRSLLGAGVRSYRWMAFSGIGCKRKYDLCGDRAPDASLASARAR
jgi:hypothetical protein